MKLRPYQEKQVLGVYAEWQAGHRNVLNVLPTGGGKTVEMGKIAADLQVPGVAIAHRKELIGQISRAMAAFGLRHNIIAADGTVRACIQSHVERFGRSYYDSRAKFTVSSVDTLAVRADTLIQWANTVGCWLIDECFPAGTMVDGRPIETLSIGDMVTAFDETSGDLTIKPITRLFKNPMPDQMIRLAWAHHVLYVTGGHPIWTRRGWMNAKDLTTSDEVLDVQLASQPTKCEHGTVSSEWSTILQHDVQHEIQINNFIGDDGCDQQATSISENEIKQPDEIGNVPIENGVDAEGNWARTAHSWWERKTADQSRNDADVATGSDGICGAICISHDIPERNGADALQNRLCPSDIENSSRGRRDKSHRKASDIRSAEGCISEWVRLESVTVLQRNNSDFPAGDSVYNIEVADLHTYTAAGIVVHNCHHCLPDNKWGRAISLFPNAYGIGFTATPVRADRRSLGRTQNGLFDAMVIGPPMRELIDSGSLCDYRIFAPPASIHREDIEIGSTGDFSAPSLRKVMHESKIVGDVVASYIRFAKGRRGITFVVDVDQATDVALAYQAQGIRAEAVSAKTPELVREGLMKKFERGDLDQLVNVDLFGEGLDVPAVEVVSMARPTESYGLYVQQFGRALRLLPGKSHGIIIDHVGNVRRHGLPDAPRKWSLFDEQAGKRRLRDPDVEPVSTCTSCFLAYSGFLKICPHCGFQSVPAGRKLPEQVAGDLEELDPEILAAMRGEIARIDGSPLIPAGVSDIVAKAISNNWRNRQAVQNDLRAAIAQWAGNLKYIGQTDSQIYRRFYHNYGVDIATAQTLNAADATKLMEKISE